MRSRPGLRWILIIGLIAFPFVLPSNWADMAVRASILTLSLLSIVILTGWVGQISLAQAALMGVGAFTAAQMTNHLNIEYPFHALFAGAAAALVAVLIGTFALRIRGLYLAIATLAFQWAIEASFLEWRPFSGGFNGVKIDPLKWPCCDFSDVKLLYFLVWPTTILIILMVANLRDSKTGRAWFAIRSSEVAAKTLGINVTRYKLLAFAVSGFVIGVAGSMNLNFIGTATPLDYNFQRSITFLAVAVLGGIGAIAGAVVGAIAYVFSDQYVLTLWDFLKDKTDLFAAGLLVFTILQNPAGIIGVREQIRERVAERQARKERRGQRKSIVLEPAVATEGDPPGDGAELVGATAVAEAGPPPISGGQEQGESSSSRLAAYTSARGQRIERPDAAPMLEVRDVTIRFGGVVANNSVSYEVRPGEICGLIGPNGAGKTTNFNCVNGLLVPNSGSVRFMGGDITNTPVHDRARQGMARTFQLMRLFPRLTVFDNLMVGTHLQNASGFTSNLLMLGGTRKEDRRNRERVMEVLAMLGISEYADSRVAGLPFGVLRLVELGRALVTQPRLLLLDEPASGLDVSETDAFAEILFKVRDEMGHTIFIIEHDMRLVMMICDYLYVLEFGSNLAEGFPHEIQSNPAVIAAYLGEESVA
jgi:ABC-type branched-subunit amino acid transport system ATPase component/ABC-type branched-subunit amino acid transport system permease subunit